MSEPITELLYGNRAVDNPPANRNEDTIRIRGASDGKPAWFSLGKKELSTGLLCIGGTGSGKTNAIESIVQQLKKSMGPEDTMLIFDTKGDFFRDFYEADRGDRVLGSGSFASRSESWNLFREVLVDGYGQPAALNIQEISRALFKPYESAQQPFFANAARGIFSAYLLHAIRKAQEDPVYARKNLNNRAIFNYFNNANNERFKQLAASYPDLGYIELYLGEGKNNQALGVLAELQVMIQDCFIGNFSGNGEFSVRDFVRKKNGRTLFIEYDLAIGSVLSPVYSLLIDLALKEVLGHQIKETEPGNVYVVLDEFKLLPHLSHLDDAVNFGRSMGIKLIAGLQAISQVYDIYGEDKARSVVAGFGSILAFRPNDAKTREFVSEYFGKTLTAETILVGEKPDCDRRQGYTVEDWELRKLVVGEAFVSVMGRLPYRYRFPEYKKDR